MNQSEPLRRLPASAPRKALPANTVIRLVCDRYETVLGHLSARHDGTPAGMIAAARLASAQMFLAYEDASNMNSPIIATDAAGTPAWIIAPNFQIIEEIGAHFPLLDVFRFG